MVTTLVRIFLQWLNDGYEQWLFAEHHWLRMYQRPQRAHEVTTCTVCVYGDVNDLPQYTVRKTIKWRSALRRYRRSQ